MSQERSRARKSASRRRRASSTTRKLANHGGLLRFRSCRKHESPRVNAHRIVSTQPRLRPNRVPQETTMIRVLAASAAALAGNDAHTTRVVPEHVHGATVTVEEGVRVFRPLPSDRHVIVNPEGE